MTDQQVQMILTGEAVAELIEILRATETFEQFSEANAGADDWFAALERFDREPLVWLERFIETELCYLMSREHRFLELLEEPTLVTFTTGTVQRLRILGEAREEGLSLDNRGHHLRIAFRAALRQAAVHQELAEAALVNTRIMCALKLWRKMLESGSLALPHEFFCAEMPCVNRPFEFWKERHDAGFQPELFNPAHALTCAEVITSDIIHSLSELTNESESTADRTLLPAHRLSVQLALVMAHVESDRRARLLDLPQDELFDTISRALSLLHVLVTVLGQLAIHRDTGVGQWSRDGGLVPEG